MAAMCNMGGSAGASGLHHSLALLTCLMASCHAFDVTSMAWDVALDMKGQNGAGYESMMRPALLDYHLTFAKNPAVETKNAGSTVTPLNGASAQRSWTMDQEAESQQHNAKVLQFCSTLMPEHVCSAAAVKWLHPDSSIPSESKGVSSDRTLRSISVKFKACIDVKFPGAVLAIGGGAENATGNRDEELALLDLSSAFHSLRAWKKEEVL